MKRARKAATPVPLAAVAKELHELVREKLQEDYLGFVSGTHTEDPKQFISRNAAAREALAHLIELATHAGGTSADAGESTLDQLIEVARLSLTVENKP